jgi:hypothetical protein
LSTATIAEAKKQTTSLPHFGTGGNNGSSSDDQVERAALALGSVLEPGTALPSARETEEVPQSLERRLSDDPLIEERPRHVGQTQARIGIVGTVAGRICGMRAHLPELGEGRGDLTPARRRGRFPGLGSAQAERHNKATVIAIALMIRRIAILLLGSPGNRGSCFHANGAGQVAAASQPSYRDPANDHLHGEAPCCSSR